MEGKEQVIGDPGPEVQLGSEWRRRKWGGRVETFSDECCIEGKGRKGLC